MLAALLAAGSAQAQVTGVSIKDFSSSNDCAVHAMLEYRIDAASSGTGTATTEVAQGGKTGTYTWPDSYPSVHAGISLDTFTGSLTSWADVDKTQPFTVTFSFNDGANTFSDTIGVGKCSPYPSTTYVPTYTATPNSTTNGSVSCKPSPVAEGDTTICTATPDPGYTLGGMTVASGSAGTITCSGLICTLPNVQSNVTVSATFTKAPPGNATAVPTLGEGALLLSGLALAGAAAPALRRRKKQGKKSDTRR